MCRLHTSRGMRCTYTHESGTFSFLPLKRVKAKSTNRGLQQDKQEMRRSCFRANRVSLVRPGTKRAGACAPYTGAVAQFPGNGWVFFRISLCFFFLFPEKSLRAHVGATPNPPVVWGPWNTRK